MTGEKHKRAIRSEVERYFLLPVSAMVKKQAHIYELLYLIIFSHSHNHLIQSLLHRGIMIHIAQMKGRYGHSFLRVKLEGQSMFISVPVSATYKVGNSKT